jgi:hypothetical protein
MRRMDAIAAMLIVVFQLFFGWCGEDGATPPPPAPADASAGR